MGRTCCLFCLAGLFGLRVGFCAGSSGCSVSACVGAVLSVFVRACACVFVLASTPRAGTPAPQEHAALNFEPEHGKQLDLHERARLAIAAPSVSYLEPSPIVTCAAPMPSTSSVDLVPVMFSGAPPLAASKTYGYMEPAHAVTVAAQIFGIGTEAQAKADAEEAFEAARKELMHVLAAARNMKMALEAKAKALVDRTELNAASDICRGMCAICGEQVTADHDRCKTDDEDYVHLVCVDLAKASELLQSVETALLNA